MRFRVLGLSFSLLWLLLLTCGQSPTTPQPVAGGASGTEVSVCLIMGKVTNASGNPIVQGTIKLRSFNYLATDQFQDSLMVIRDTMTDSSGLFSLSGVAKGQYLIEVTSKDSLGQSIRCDIDSGESLKIFSPVVLQPMGVVQSLTTPSDSTKHDSTIIEVSGTDRWISTDSNGHFAMPITPGWHRLHVHRSDTSHHGYDTLVYVRPAESIELHSRRHEPYSCDSSSCDLAVIKSLLLLNGIDTLAADSIVGFTQNRVTSLSLRHRNLHILPSSLGRLSRLEILDVGANNLDSLPQIFYRLHHLHTFIADSNALVSVTTSLGTLDSLKVLDLSHNQLLSLPSPLADLKPSLLLDVNGNRLCNLGETTARWIDRYDRDWRYTQHCQ